MGVDHITSEWARARKQARRTTAAPPAAEAPAPAGVPAPKAAHPSGAKTPRLFALEAQSSVTRALWGEHVARRAAGLVGRSVIPAKVPNDCSGLVRVAYYAVGVELLHRPRREENAVTAIYRRAESLGAVHRGKPHVGDLIFFRETYDRNGDGRRNDGLTHIGIVESVAPTGTVTFVHRVGPGVMRSRVTPRQPGVYSRGGRVLNDLLRREEGGERARLTGELFVGYAAAGRLGALDAR
ncbi:NlpC/P60 family protein [Melittangium boletus]|uniref:NlpC/P60 family protein n=1 Tax=Melittangium boletus TaxID=83453 RepID=UPI003DA1FA92